MQLKELLTLAINKLKENKIEEPVIKARILLENVLHVDKQFLVVHSQKQIEEKLALKYLENIEKLIQGFPIQYITNKQEFMKLNFYVDSNVLIPQPDTEILVEEVIKKQKQKILDLCTGSGAIAISLAKYIKNSNVCGTDISEQALKIAKKNAKANNVKVNFFKSDLFENINEKFEIIVSNPPYIETEVIKTLKPEVQKEPHIALDGGQDGLNFYRKIIKQAPKFLKKDGMLFLEIGYNQKEAVENLLQNSNKYEKIECIKDLAGNYRVIIACRTIVG